MKFKRLLIILLPLLVIAAAAYWFLSAVPASYGYSVESEFSVLPADDARLEQWLKVQPGVVAHTVRIERAGAREAVLKVHFIQSRNLLGRPAFPELDQACHDLGYDRPVLKFHDSAHR